MNMRSSFMSTCPDDPFNKLGPPRLACLSLAARQSFASSRNLFLISTADVF